MWSWNRTSRPCFERRVFALRQSCVLSVRCLEKNKPSWSAPCCAMPHSSASSVPSNLFFLLFLNKPGIHAIHVYLWRIFRSARAKYIIPSFQTRLLIVMLTSRSSCSEVNALEKQRHSDNWLYIRDSTTLVTKVCCINRIELKWFMRTIFYWILDPRNLETFDNCTNIETQVSRLWRCRNGSVSRNCDLKRAERRKGRREWKRKRNWESKRSANIKDWPRTLTEKAKFLYFWFVINETFINAFVTFFWLKRHQTRYTLEHICSLNKWQLNTYR